MSLDFHVQMMSKREIENNNIPLVQSKYEKRKSEFEEKVPDLKYRAFMLQLSSQMTSKDEERLKYLLTSAIPDGKMEVLNTPLKLFRQFERLDWIGPKNIPGLKFLQLLFELMQREELGAMIANFVVNQKVEPANKD